MKIIVLFVEYNNQLYPNAFYYLNRYLNAIKDIKFKIIHIDNTSESQEFIYSKVNDIDYIHGDNHLYDFSAWDKGLKYLKRNNIAYDAVLFVNDSFLNPSFTGLGRIINKDSFKRCIDKKALFGARGGSGKEFYYIGDYTLSTWVRSHCFMIERSALEKLESIITLDHSFINDCISQEIGKSYFKESALLNPAIRNKVIDWLYEGGSSINAFKFEDNWQKFRTKTLAYFNELTLAAMAEKEGINVVKLD